MECKKYKFFLSSFYFYLISFIPLAESFAQEISYSTKAQNLLSTYSADNLDVFKFSINDILNSVGDNVENANGDPKIFGRTDFGSEFFLENELNDTSSIEIPAFVIDDLAENEFGNYFPVIRNGAINLLIDFTDLYDVENGQVIKPEMGFVKLLEPATTNQYTNLIDGDIIEFFVEPSDAYRNNHNSENLFFIDRPIPPKPVIADVTKNEEEYGDTSLSANEDQVATISPPGDELLILPNEKKEVYVTSIYVQAPASKFQPNQIVMPVLADGDYNYEIEPAPAGTFSDDLQVVLLPDEEAKIISEKIKVIKATKSQKYKRERDLPAIDPEVNALFTLQKLDIENQKSAGKLLSDAKKNIRKNFPNMSDELINLVINRANSDEKFDLLQNPKEFLDQEFAKISDLTELNSILSMDLPQNDLIKIYNLISYKFSSELAELGFDTKRDQKIEFFDKINYPDKILDQVQLQRDILATVSLFGSDEGLASLLIDPVKTNPDSSTTLFESRDSQKVLDQIRQFSAVINNITSSLNRINTLENASNDNIPIVEINVQLGESITDALLKKLNEDKRINRGFQARSQRSKLEKFDFELPPQDESSVPLASAPLLTEAPSITDQELQLVAETTEATNNIINETITRMLAELGDYPADQNSILMVSATDNPGLPDQENAINDPLVFSNALSSAKRLREIEDIRAIFQILGIGS